MYKKVFFLAFILTSLFGCFNSNAANIIAGSDAQWKCLGNDTYQITLVVYRRCTDYPGSFNLAYYPPTLTTDSFTSVINIGIGLERSYIIEDITPICLTGQKPCGISGGSGTSNPLVPLGLERHTIVYKVYLGNYNCCWYKLKWQYYSRNASISTGLAGTPHINEFWINRCVVNNSPKFTTEPLLIRCAGQEVRYNFGMVDDEDDSLTYNLSPPGGGGTYTSPWNFTYPLTCLGGNNPKPNATPPTGFNLDSATGDVFFRPMTAQSSVIKITVTEWRKIGGVPKIIGVTNRDFQIVILQNCNNKLPNLSGPYKYDICAGSQFCFTINTSDADAIDTTRISSTSLLTIPNSTFVISSNTTKRAYGDFCWTPSANDARQRPYLFCANVYDDHCPVIGNNSATYAIIVHSSLSVKTNIEKLSCANYTFIADRDDKSSFNRKWTIYKNGSLFDSILNTDTVFDYRFTSIGNYIIQYTTTNACLTVTTSDTLVVTNVTPLSIVTSTTQNICKGDSVTLMSTPLNGTPPYTYEWYLNNILVSTQQTFKMLPLANATYKVKVISADSCKMNFTDTVRVNVFSKGIIYTPLTDITHCKGSNLLLYPQIIYGTPPFKYEWYHQGVLIGNTDIIQTNPTSSTDYMLKVISSDPCFNVAMDTVHVTVDTSGLAFKPISDTAICNTDTIVIKPIIYKGKPPIYYRWYLNGKIISLDSILKVAQYVSTRYTLIVNSQDNCYKQIADTFEVLSDNTPQLQTRKLRDTIVCAGETLGIVPQILKGSAPFEFKWYNNGVLVSTASNLNVVPTSSSKYYVEITSSNKCFNHIIDSFNVNVINANPLMITATKTQLVYNQSTVLKSNGNSHFNWSGPNIVTDWGDSILVKPLATSKYYLKSKNPSGCNDSAEILINVSNVGIQIPVSTQTTTYHIYPNPASKELRIECSIDQNLSPKVLNAHFEILNPLGQLLITNYLKDGLGIVNISALPQGIYFLRIDGSVVGKFLKE